MKYRKIITEVTVFAVTAIWLIMYFGHEGTHRMAFFLERTSLLLIAALLAGLLGQEAKISNLYSGFLAMTTFLQWFIYEIHWQFAESNEIFFAIIFLIPIFAVIIKFDNIAKASGEWALIIPAITFLICCFSGFWSVFFFTVIYAIGFAADRHNILSISLIVGAVLLLISWKCGWHMSVPIIAMAATYAILIAADNYFGSEIRDLLNNLSSKIKKDDP